MTPFSELASSKEYWLTKIQNELYNCVEDYCERQGWNRTQLAEHLGFTRGYVSQVLNGDFDHKLSKLIALALAVGVVPNIKFQEIDQYVASYLSGYDFCLNSDSVSVSIEVNNSLNDYVLHATNEHLSLVSQLVDNESFITFTPATLAA